MTSYAHTQKFNCHELQEQRNFIRCDKHTTESMECKITLNICVTFAQFFNDSVSFILNISKKIFVKVFFSDQRFFITKLIIRIISYNLSINSGGKRFFFNFSFFFFFFFVNLVFPMSIWKLLNVFLILYIRSTVFIKLNLCLTGIKIRTVHRRCSKEVLLKMVL